MLTQIAVVAMGTRVCAQIPSGTGKTVGSSERLKGFYFVEVLILDLQPPEL